NGTSRARKWKSTVARAPARSHQNELRQLREEKRPCNNSLQASCRHPHHHLHHCSLPGRLCSSITFLTGTRPCSSLGTRPLSSELSWTASRLC
ncbi:hypothetical protein E4U35_006133, partial [Claviceps purpurea]